MNKALTLLSFVAVLNSAALAHEVIYFGVLAGVNENPSNASPGTGTARVTMDLDLATMRVEINFAGLVGNTTASHIHFGNGPGTNGAVATMLPSFTGFPLGVTSGTYDHTYDMALASSYNPAFITANGNTVGGAFAAFQSKLDAGFGYLNIHSSVYGGGELRANLTAVPEPASWALMSAGCVAMALRRRRNRR